MAYSSRSEFLSRLRKNATANKTKNTPADGLTTVLEKSQISSDLDLESFQLLDQAKHLPSLYEESESRHITAEDTIYGKENLHETEAEDTGVNFPVVEKHEGLQKPSKLVGETSGESITAILEKNNDSTESTDSDSFSDFEDSDEDPDYVEDSSDEYDSDNEPLSNIKKRICEATSPNDNRSTSPPVFDEPYLKNKKRKWKVIKGDTREYRKNRKICKNLGKEHRTLKGKMIRGKVCKPLTTCRKECVGKISADAQKQLFKDFWSLGDYDKRVAFTSSLILIKQKKTKKLDASKKRDCVYKYHLYVGGDRVEVCKKCFQNTFDLSNKFIEYVNKKTSVSGTTQDDQRGLNVPVNKIENERIDLVKAHILSVPSYESHYCREKGKDKRVLPAHYTLTRLYDEYKHWIVKQTHKEPVSRKFYESCFKRMNIKIKRYSKDTCQNCDKMNRMIQNEKNADKKNKLKEDLTNHQAAAEEAYNAKTRDKEIGKNRNDLIVYSFDLQQCLPTPNLTTSVAFYKRQLWTYNLTIHDCTNDRTTCCMWYESISGRGANQVGSCLYKELMTLPKVIKKVILYSDTCGGQNKNTHIVVMFLNLIKNSKIGIIEHKFLIPGHTRMECDNDHSVIERRKKKYENPIEHPRDWYQLVRMCGRKTPFKVTEMTFKDFYDFAAVLKSHLQNKSINTEGEKFIWHNVRWLRYEKEADFGVFKYKNSLDENEPFKTMSFSKRNISMPGDLPICKHPNPISKEKKKNLMELLPYINDLFHTFYKNLPTEKDLAETMTDSEESENEN